MIKLRVTVPIACFRPGAAREFWETHPLPPPSTLYGFLLSLVGETDRNCHVGVRCTAGLLNQPERSTVLRKLWRIKEYGENKSAQGAGTNVRPDFQHLLTDIQLVVFVDSTEEKSENENTLENRIKIAMNPETRNQISRFGGLSLGESTHMVDEVSLLETSEKLPRPAMTYLAEDDGNLTLPIWVDHVGREGTRYVTGRIVQLDFDTPPSEKIPKIDNGTSQLVES